MIEFTLVEVNNDDTIADILCGLLKVQILPRKGDRLVYNDKKYVVSNIVFNFVNDSCEKIIVMVKSFEPKVKANNPPKVDNSRSFYDTGSMFI